MIRRSNSLSANALFKLTLAVLPIVYFSACSSPPPVALGPKENIVPVTVAPVVQKTVPIEVRAIGNVEAYSTVSIKAQVAGTIEQIYFKEGQDVRKDDLLYTLDSRPYQAALHQLEANLARDQAQLENASAQAERYAKLFESGIVSREQYDTFRTNSDALSAALRADKAEIEKARIDLDYCTIRSPLDGRTGSLLVHSGNVVRPNDTVLVVINQIVPIYITFTVPEQNLAEIKRRMAAGSLALTAATRDDEQHPAEGTITFVDNSVDTSTGTIRLKGSFSNQERHLWPGQFVNVVLTISNQPGAIVVPSQAVQTGQSGFYAYVVKSDQSAELRPVVPGNQWGGETVIEKGLQPGETVVTDGQLLLYPGAKVAIKGSPASSQGKPS